MKSRSNHSPKNSGKSVCKSEFTSVDSCEEIVVEFPFENG